MLVDLLDRYRHKIKTAEELRDIIGPRPREQAVIMCHGVFDVVHPGHVRHLLYAKSKADVLIASITADHHITKGTHRPHVPQDLRAVNLAAFEMVDYVVIDKNAKPLENIRLIQPDYFAKGFEYTASGMPAKTAEEARGRPVLRRRDHLHARRHRLFLIEPDQSRAAGDQARKAADRHGAQRHHLRQAAADARRHGRPPRARRRRHHRRQLYPLRHDRRPDQDADHERAVRAQGRLRRRRRPSWPSTWRRPAAG